VGGEAERGQHVDQVGTCPPAVVEVTVEAGGERDIINGSQSSQSSSLVGFTDPEVLKHEQG